MLHLQLSPFQWFNKDLKWLKLLVCLKCSGKLFHRTAAAYLKEFLPYVVVRTVGICKIFEYLKLYLFSLIFTKFDNEGGAKSCSILKVSRAMVRNHRIFRVGIFAFSKSSSYVETKSS